MRKRWKCNNAHSWCSLARLAAYVLGLKSGRSTVVLDGLNGTRRIFCSEECCERWRP